MQACQDIDRLVEEHVVLMRAHAQAQARCGELQRAHDAHSAAMAAQLMRERAATIRLETALAWEREDRAALAAAIPGLDRRVALGRRIEMLQARVHDLTRTLQRRDLAAHSAPVSEPLAAELEASLHAADLVICQTGCMSHGDYWRVQDHCKRTGKLCMLVDQPDGLQIVRIHRDDAALVP